MAADVKNFVNTLADVSTQQESLVCMGLDPVIALENKDEKKKLPDSLVKSEIEKYGKAVGIGKAIDEFYCEIIEGVVVEGAHVASIKPNYAFYAQFGFPGLRALKSIIEFAHKNKMHVILDAKRGDIGNTSKAYAVEAFEFWDVDAVTVAPYMGEDSVGPFIDLAKKKGRGIYILARTSNKGAKNLQNLIVKEKETPFYLEVARCVKDEWSKDAKGTVGVVVGATSPQEYCNITEFLATTIIPQLIPGFGTQGGKPDEIFEGAIKVYQKLGLDKEQILTRLKTKRANSSSELNYAYNLLPGFDESNYVDATIKAIGNFNAEIGKPLSKYGLSLRQK